MPHARLGTGSILLFSLCKVGGWSDLWFYVYTMQARSWAGPTLEFEAFKVVGRFTTSARCLFGYNRIKTHHPIALWRIFFETRAHFWICPYSLKPRGLAVG